MSQAIAAYDKLNRDFKNVGLTQHASGDMMRVALMRYNPSTLAWEAFTGVEVSTESLTVEVDTDDLESLVADSFYKSTKLAFDATDNLAYVGKNTDAAAADGDTDWEVWKYTWAAGAVSGYILTAKQGPVTGSWTGRGALF